MSKEKIEEFKKWGDLMRALREISSSIGDLAAVVSEKSGRIEKQLRDITLELRRMKR